MTPLSRTAPSASARPRRRAWLATGITGLVALLSPVALLTAPVPAQAAVDEAAAAIALFQQASSGRRDAVDEAAARLSALSAAAPADPVLRAYAGAATSLRATTTVLPWRKLAHAEDGLASIDKALAQISPAHDQALHGGVPASLETRFVAASTFLAVPGFMNRAERGRKLLDAVLASPQFDAAPAGFRAAVWLRAGQLAEKEQRAADARRWYTRVAETPAPQASAARARLAGL